MAALRDPSENLLHVSNLIYHKFQAPLADQLAKITGLDRAFFANTGTEAVEGAIKLARAFGRERSPERTGVLAVQNSFHGRTLGALAATWPEKYRKPFEPLPAGMSFIRQNDVSHLESSFNDGVGALLLEVIQGEGGVVPAPAGYLKAARDACDAAGALLVLEGKGVVARYAVECLRVWAVVAVVWGAGRLLRQRPPGDPRPPPGLGALAAGPPLWWPRGSVVASGGVLGRGAQAARGGAALAPGAAGPDGGEEGAPALPPWAPVAGPGRAPERPPPQLLLFRRNRRPHHVCVISFRVRRSPILLARLRHPASEDLLLLRPCRPRRGRPARARARCGSRATGRVNKRTRTKVVRPSTTMATGSHGNEKRSRS